ncbi:MAG: helix-turn-helix domain-containing protein [Methanomicrobiales archaeon]|jgi:excisionase family DNA binding protein|nr:helix-turn-helix domain-containing protein [Methanomicrobiales archaeon]
MAKTPPHTFYTTEEVAAMLHLHPQTVRNLILKKRMGAIKIGMEWRVSEEDLTEFIRENRNK